MLLTVAVGLVSAMLQFFLFKNLFDELNKDLFHNCSENNDLKIKGYQKYFYI